MSHYSYLAGHHTNPYTNNSNINQQHLLKLKDENRELEHVYTVISSDLFSLRYEVNRLLDLLRSATNTSSSSSDLFDSSEYAFCPLINSDEKEIESSEEYSRLYESYSLGFLSSGISIKRSDPSLVPHFRSKYKVKMLPSGWDSKILLPFVLGRALVRVSIYSLGSLPFSGDDHLIIDHLRPYHTRISIYPPGFISKRKFYALKEITKRVYYLSAIEPGPVFKIYLQSDPSLVWQSTTSTQEAYDLLLASFVDTITPDDPDWPIFTSGDDFFGLEHPVVRKQIEEMPGACYCINYYKYAEDPLSI